MARLVIELTNRCNLRCHYPRPEDLPAADQSHVGKGL